MTCSRATTLPAFRARISSTRYPFRTEDKYLPSIVPERMAKLLTTRCSPTWRRRPLYVEGREGGGSSFSPSCLCSRRRATQGAKGRICQGGRRGGSADRAAGRCQMQKLRKAWLSGLH